MGSKEITDGLVRRGRFGIERHTDTQRDNKGRDGRDAPPRIARSHQKLGERPGQGSLCASRRNQHLDLELLSSGSLKEYISDALSDSVGSTLLRRN